MPPAIYHGNGTRCALGVPRCRGPHHEVLSALCDCDFNALDVVANLTNQVVRVCVRPEECDVCENTVYLFLAVA